jgi:asparagine synthase (glutamine-hydrolysing)
VKVALSGDGGDEIFAGYWSFFQVERLKAMGAIPAPARRCIGALADLLPYSAYGKNYLRLLSRPEALDRYFEGLYAPHYLLRQLLEPEWVPPADAAYFRRLLPECLLEEKADLLSQALYFETAANLTGDMLVKVDRMSMANSLEVRCPLLDHRLAELAARIPPAWKMRNGRGKQIFLRAVGHRLPPELLTLPKKGFGVPLGSWFRTSLRELLHDCLLSTRALNRGIVSPRFVRYLLDEHQRERRDNSGWLWRLLMLELWFQSFEQRAGAVPERSAALPV